jgi:hypothetical protein
MTCETQMFDCSRHTPFKHSSPTVQGELSASFGSHVPAVEHFRISMQGKPSPQASPGAPLMSQCLVTPQWYPVAHIASTGAQEAPPWTVFGIWQVPLDLTAPPSPPPDDETTQRSPSLTLQSPSAAQGESLTPTPLKRSAQASVYVLISSYALPAGTPLMQRLCRLRMHLSFVGTAQAAMTASLHSA